MLIQTSLGSNMLNEGLQMATPTNKSHACNAEYKAGVRHSFEIP